MVPEPAQVESLLLQVAEARDFDVIKVKVDGRRNVRMWVDREPNGVNVDDTTQLSRALTEAIEAEGLDPGSFQFEIQSPGLDRLLARQKDFVRFAGEEVKVRLYAKKNNRANFTGKLVGWRDGHVLLTVEDTEWSFTLEEIREARVIPKLPFGNANPKNGSSGRHKRHKHSGRQRKRKRR